MCKLLSKEENKVELATPTSNKNIAKNQPLEQIIGSKDKCVMIRNIINEELCLIFEEELKNSNQACKDDH